MNKGGDEIYYEGMDCIVNGEWREIISRNGWKKIPQLIDEKSAVKSWFRLIEAWKNGRLSEALSHKERLHLCYEVIFKNWKNEWGPVPVWIPSRKTFMNSNVKKLMDRAGFENYQDFLKFCSLNREKFFILACEVMGLPVPSAESEVYRRENVKLNEWLPYWKGNIISYCFRKDTPSKGIVEGHYDGRILFYSMEEITENVFRLMRGLRSIGVKKGTPVGICMPMSAFSVMAYLAIVGVGGVVVSIADSLSEYEIQKRLQIAGASLLITQDIIPRKDKEIPLYERIKNAMDVTCIILPYEKANQKIRIKHGDINFHDLMNKGIDKEFEVCSSTDFINILFSSGTTAEPKAIPWTHVTPFKCAIDGFLHLDIKAHDIVAWPTNIGWMMGPWLIFASFMNGASMSLFIGSPTDEEFLKFIFTTNTSVLGLVPSMVRKWIDMGCLEKPYLTKIRLFSSTGEASNPQDYFILMSSANFSPVIEYCGGTEIGGGYITGTLAKYASPATFSTPALGIDFVIVDNNLRNAKEGELFILPPSPGLSFTLLNKNHDEVYYKLENKEIGHLVSACGVNVSELVKTYNTVLRYHGDVMEALPNGYFKSHGRADDTMNLSGIKISSVEIEECVKQLDEVYDVAAIAYDPPAGGPSKLVLYIIPRVNISKEEMKKKATSIIKSRLSPYFSVYDVVFIDNLPRTPTNKVMRRILKKEYAERIENLT